MLHPDLAAENMRSASAHATDESPDGSPPESPPRCSSTPPSRESRATASPYSTARSPPTHRPSTDRAPGSGSRPSVLRSLLACTLRRRPTAGQDTSSSALANLQSPPPFPLCHYHCEA